MQTTKKFWLLVVSTLLLMFGMTPKDRAQESPQVFSAADQFSVTENPNGPWSYGYTAGLGGPFTLHTVNCSSCGPGAIYDGWFGSFFGFYPWVVTSQGGRFIDTLDLHPALPNFYSVVRWTAPTSGRFDLLGLFVGLGIPATTDVHVLKNSVSVFDSQIRTQIDTSIFDLRVYVVKGDTIDFAVGIGSDGSMDSDATGLKATITGPQDN